eukprot:gb/GFBE01014103.1/.p1 GENE.gb/GFBE01014103.1/~~gb/GFBE01014103.1/.p1  ORF type:complete len:153 (+),score=9.99 gb/GFBE01014103.1/:1-459(+)
MDLHGLRHHLHASLVNQLEISLAALVARWSNHLATSTVSMIWHILHVEAAVDTLLHALGAMPPSSDVDRQDFSSGTSMPRHTSQHAQLQRMRTWLNSAHRRPGAEFGPTKADGEPVLLRNAHRYLQRARGKGLWTDALLENDYSMHEECNRA